MTRSRCSWDRPPWSAAASWPRPLRRSASSSTSPRVRANTSAEVGSSRSRIRAERRQLVGAADHVGDLADGARRRVAASAALTVTRTGSWRCRLATRAMTGDTVAENSAVWRSPGVAASTASRSSAKPMSSISSASSSTTTRTASSRRLPRFRWSTARPGVATTTSTPRAQRPQLEPDGLAAVDRQRPDAQPARRIGGPPPTPASRARGWAPAPASRPAVGP